jgi:hypothetical protein
MKIATLRAASLIALASDAAAAKPTDKKAKKPADRTPPVLTDITDAIPVPANAKKRGQQSVYGLEKLEVGQSVGVIGKTAKQLQPTVALTNRRFMVDKKDDAGNTMFKIQEVKDANGIVTKIPSN